MYTMKYSAFLLAVSLLSLTACQKAADAPKTDAAASGTGAVLKADASDADKIASALSAAPAAIGAQAAVMEMTADAMKELKAGTNGFTCIPDNPATPGPDPMCVDETGMGWMHAMMSGSAPPKGKFSIAYMLQGGSDASNTDPKATTPAEGQTWVTTGPHIMIIGDPAMLAGFPQDAKDTSKPYVMFPGTPYAHLMLPVK